MFAPTWRTGKPLVGGAEGMVSPILAAHVDEGTSASSGAVDSGGKMAPPTSDLMMALGNEYGMLQSARGATISESSSRGSLFMTTLSGAVVGLSFVAQASHFGQAFYVFALTIMPVVFFLGVVTYYRLLQTGVEDVIYARAISKIRALYKEVDPTRASYFDESTVDQVGLTKLGLFTSWWQQFLTAAAMIAIVNGVVGGVFIALTVSYFLTPPPAVAIGIGAAAVLLLSAAFIRHQWTIWGRVSALLPMAVSKADERKSSGRGKA